METTTNPLCPDYSSHAENVAEVVLSPDFAGTSDQWETFDDIVDRLAEAEYRACEGH